MKQEPDLLKKLMEYGKSDFYPFHMPGHKRKWYEDFGVNFPNPFIIDITEIEGFDNLHHPEGILKDSMEWAAEIYGSKKTYYLVNGSSSGILSAICGTVSHGGTILMSRNCHKSAYHGVFLKRLKTEYVYPQIIPELCIQGGLLPEDIERLLISNPDIEAVLIVSPTYDGVVSDIKAISEVVHRFQIPLIVDEAHGAHFPFGKEAGFPASALDLGADVVVQSLHKTLPSFTQTALLHVKSQFVSHSSIERYLGIFQTSSPSYIFLAGMENCLRYMEKEGRSQMVAFSEKLEVLYKKLESMKKLKVFCEYPKGKFGIFERDRSKIIISTKGTGISGIELGEILRDKYKIELEMYEMNYVTAISTLADTEEGMKRFYNALLEIDEELQNKKGHAEESSFDFSALREKPACLMSIGEAMDRNRRQILLSQASGAICAEFVYLYPPGIPLIVPGEVVTEEVINQIISYKKKGFSIQGMEDFEGKRLYVAEDAKQKNCRIVPNDGV